MFRLFDLHKAAAGLDHAHHKEQHQQGVADGLERAVNVRYHGPDRAALEVLGGLGDKLPDLTQLAVPDLQRIFQVLHDPIIRHAKHLLQGQAWGLPPVFG